MKASTLRLTAFDAVPEDMKALGAIANRLHISRSGLLRMLIVKYIRAFRRAEATEK